MNEIHKGEERVRVVTICLVLVKIYGNNPIKLLSIINKKTLINKTVLPSKEVGPNNILNSLCILFRRDLIKILRFEGINQNIGEIIIMKITDLIQFLIINIDDEGSKTEKRFVIMII